MESGDKTKILFGLVALTLILSLVNTANTFDLNNRIGMLSGNVIADEQLKEAQPQPTEQQQQQPTAQVSTDDDPLKGSASAPVTIIEFSDFECPFCTRFWKDTLPQIEENYIDTGKVKFVYRDFPLGFHANAQKAAEASECADEQGKYWKYHDRLFETGALDVTSLKQHAADLGLNTATFNDCLDSGKYADEVQKDLSDGSSYGVSGTPSFFINGVNVVGAQPYSVFEQVIEQLI